MHTHTQHAHATHKFFRHPDKNGNSREATEAFQKVNAAYKRLSAPPGEDEGDEVDIDDSDAAAFFMYM